MAGYNRVILMGNLTRDPQLRYTPSGTAVSDFGIAVNKRIKSQDGAKQEKTTFVDVTVWRRTAEVVCQYLSKGSPIFLEGYLELDSWKTEDGQNRSKLRVIADNVQFLPRAGAGGGGGGGGDQGVPQPPMDTADDDDIPF